MNNEEEKRSLNFIEEFIEEDLKTGKHNGRVHFRFPPEPNGYLHIGHAKAICLNFGLAEKYNGKCNLRYDDTNPEKEEQEYIDAIRKDIHWLGYDWEDREFYASDYFDKLYEWAIVLIRKGLAYVDESSADEVAANRGTPTEPGKESAYRNRSPGENLDLLERMKNGEFPDGSKVLRAKIDMASPNMHMRDPVIYRIKHMTHPHTGDKWCIYPMYDWAHGQSDYIEGITHSLCTLEFEVHRPLYDWFLDNILDDPGGYRPRQYEFARLNLNYTVMSKRMLLRLVKEGHVRGWDDPRMPTLSAFRRRGFTPESIRTFSEKVGIAKRENVIDIGLLEFYLREDLNKKAQRMMGVIRPLPVEIENYPEGMTEEMEAINNPEDERMGTRMVPFSKYLYIERDDFMEDPPKKFFRLSPGQEVRLRYAYFIRCKEAVRNKDGEIEKLICTYDPASRGGNSPDGRKVKGTLHWVSVKHAVKAEVRLYDRLFNREDPYETEQGKDFISNLNPDSLEILTGYIEPFIKNAKPADKFQFERLGYFCVDQDSSGDKLVVNRTVPLRDSWSKINQKKQ